MYILKEYDCGRITLIKKLFVVQFNFNCLGEQTQSSDNFYGLVDFCIITVNYNKSILFFSSSPPPPPHLPSPTPFCLFTLYPSVVELEKLPITCLSVISQFSAYCIAQKIKLLSKFSCVFHTLTALSVSQSSYLYCVTTILCCPAINIHFRCEDHQSHYFSPLTWFIFLPSFLSDGD